MSRKEELVSLYKKERRRVQAYYSKYRRKNYSIPENAIPAIPKRITEGSIRRLQRMTPEYMKHKLVREEKRIQREEKRKQQWIKQNQTKIQATIQEDNNKIDREYQQYYEQGEQEYLSSLSSFEMAQYTHDPMYLKEYTDPKERLEYAEQFFDERITDMREKELEEIGFKKTDDGSIIDTETGKIVARDMSKQIQENLDFIESMEQETGTDMSDFKMQLEDAPFNSFEDILGNKITEEEYKRVTHERLIENRRENTRGWANGVVQGFISDISHFPSMAFPMLNPIIENIKQEAIENDNYTYAIERLAVAITSTIEELGRITYEVAYNGQFLNNFASSLERKYYNNTDFMKALNDVMELNEGDIES